MPNKLEQDGPKQRLLCHDCEELFSKWERPFAEKVFRPLHLSETPRFGIHYDGEWALKFSTSISWRVLQWLHNQQALNHLTDEQLTQSQSALATWAAFLLGCKNSVLPHEQHALLFDVIENNHTDQKLSPFLNRYLTRAFEANVIRWKSDVLTYAKMGRLLMLGYISPPAAPEAFQGTRVRMKRGTFGGPNITMPHALATFINEQASKMGSVLKGLSPKQRQRDHYLIESWGDEMGQTDSFRALCYDVNHSGDAAFSEEISVTLSNDVKK